ncbi:SRPBCC family protein [Edaphobacter acidisoli]|nr:hypothetical protein [Edaphobacter acidisoli]
MKRRFKVFGRTIAASFFLMLLLLAPCRLIAEAPTPGAIVAYNAYCAKVEARLAHQHQSAEGFLATSSSPEDANARLRRGELIIEQLSPADAERSGALLHHWRATAFAPGAKASDFVRLMQDLDSYPRYFSPQVVEAKVLSRNGDHMQVWMRVRQKHVITVVMDSSYEVSFGRLDAQHGYSNSRSMQISEIESPGTSSERSLGPGESHGFLWRQNTYWSYEERDGGLYLQVESVSLTRSIPLGLDWVIGPYVKSVPRESLEFTLRSVCSAIGH